MAATATAQALETTDSAGSTGGVGQMNSTTDSSIDYDKTDFRTTKSTVTDITEWKEARQSSIPQTGAMTLEKNEIGDSERRSELATEVDSDSMAFRVFRPHFVGQILTDLGQLQKHHGRHTAATYAAYVMKNIRQFRDRSPFDPYVEILMSLHDAMAFENRWVEYTGAQFEGAARILRSYANQDLDSAKIEKAMLKLIRLGFETMPFEIPIDFENDEEENEDQ